MNDNNITAKKASRVLIRVLMIGLILICLFVMSQSVTVDHYNATQVESPTVFLLSVHFSFVGMLQFALSIYMAINRYATIMVKHFLIIINQIECNGIDPELAFYVFGKISDVFLVLL